MKSEETLFDEAIRLPAAMRAEFIEKECGQDQALQERLEQLLAAHEQTNSFLDSVPSSPTPEAANPGTASPGANPEAAPGGKSKDAGGQIIGNYRLLQKIGEGGFGVVYMAEQKVPIRRKVALKLIKPGMDSAAVIARFEAERQALAIMDHPNIAKVFDGGTTPSEAGEVHGNGRPYFVMELVSGVPITEYCERNALDTRERLNLFVSVCQAVQHAHIKGIIHRDIKPSNVMVTLHDGVPVVKVIDFGVAKALHQRLTEKTMFTEYGQMIGTPQYMSPEQAEMSGLDVDTRSDIYSLAVLLYELLTGTTPLESKSLRAAGYAEVQRLIREQIPPVPSQRLSSTSNELTAYAKHRNVTQERLHREVKGDLDWIVMKGLEKDRSRRYESAASFADDIQRSLTDQPVAAGPPSTLYRLRKFLIRNRAQVGIVGALLLAIAPLIAWFVSYRIGLAEDQRRSSQQVTEVLEEASLQLGRAVVARVGDETDWVAAASSKQRLDDLLTISNVDEATRARAAAWSETYQSEWQDRQFAESVESLIIRRATSMDLPSWELMEQEFREIFRNRGIDLDNLPADEVGRRIRDDRAQVLLADALELWMGTRGQMASFGGPVLTKETMQPWADAIYLADPDPLRTGIRKMVYGELPRTKEQLTKLIEGKDLAAAYPRTLSWLSIACMLAQDYERANEIQRWALRMHPNDLMLNFDFALALEKQEAWDKAIRYYMRCTALRPNLAGLWRALAHAFAKNKESERALEALEHAAQLEPDHALGLIQLAKLYQSLSKYVDAIETAKRAIALDDDHFDAWRCLGESYQHVDEFAEALAAFERCDALARERELNYPTQDWIAKCHEQMGNGDDQ